MCEICKKINCDYRCPNYKTLKAIIYCSICGKGIYDGEEYIENQDGEFRHYECFQGLKDLLDWLGFEIKTFDEG